jgi:hypothetical protein
MYCKVLVLYCIFVIQLKEIKTRKGKHKRLKHQKDENKINSELQKQRNT